MEFKIGGSKQLVLETLQGNSNCHLLGGLRHRDASMVGVSESQLEARVGRESLLDAKMPLVIGTTIRTAYYWRLSV